MQTARNGIGSVAVRSTEFTTTCEPEKNEEQ
jgi:hypothetical protein